MKKVLYVDDSEDTLEIVKIVLANSGYQIITALGGKEAVEVCSNEQPDLILIDLNMPDLDGFASIQLLRSMSGFSTCETNSGSLRELLIVRHRRH